MKRVKRVREARNKEIEEIERDVCSNNWVKFI